MLLWMGLQYKPYHSFIKKHIMVVSQYESISLSFIVISNFQEIEPNFTYLQKLILKYNWNFLDATASSL